mmetsp:Transcript_56640/g.184253  ORF Transcript_56640/g.184253 Transcript_56640/m.184253 type:complete len:274 (+) Transcript_56640:1190-2011(+)
MYSTCSTAKPFCQSRPSLFHQPVETYSTASCAGTDQAKAGARSPAPAQSPSSVASSGSGAAASSRSASSSACSFGATAPHLRRPWAPRDHRRATPSPQPRPAPAVACNGAWASQASTDQTSAVGAKKAAQKRSPFLRSSKPKPTQPMKRTCCDLANTQLTVPARPVWKPTVKQTRATASRRSRRAMASSLSAMRKMSKKTVPLKRRRFGGQIEVSLNQASLKPHNSHKSTSDVRPRAMRQRAKARRSKVADGARERSRRSQGSNAARRACKFM